VIVQAYRIARAEYAASAFTGEGADQFGGRWNSPGAPVVYMAGHASLAVLEMLAQLKMHDWLKEFVLFEASFDDDLLTVVPASRLSPDWRKVPGPQMLLEIGDDWIASRKSAVLKVPSAVVPSEWNYLLNPRHPQFAKIKIELEEPFKFDPRLIKMS